MHPGRQVKRWRAERDLSLEALAERAGTDKMNLSKIERGLVNPKAGTLQKLADALGVSIAALLSGPDLSPLSGTTEPSMKEGADVLAAIQETRHKLDNVINLVSGALADLRQDLVDLDARAQAAKSGRKHA